MPPVFLAEIVSVTKNSSIMKGNLLHIYFVLAPLCSKIQDFSNHSFYQDLVNSLSNLIPP